MFKIYIVFFSVILFASCGTDESSSPEPVSFSHLLTNGTSKVWNVTKLPDDNGDPICNASRELTADNSWTFFSDGRLHFDHGTVVEDEECEVSDLINFIGTWELVNEESFLLLKVLHETENVNNVFNDTIIYGEIESLTVDALHIKMDEKSAIFSPKKLPLSTL